MHRPADMAGWLGTVEWLGTAGLPDVRAVTLSAVRTPVPVLQRDRLHAAWVRVNPSPRGILVASAVGEAEPSVSGTIATGSVVGGVTGIRGGMRAHSIRTGGGILARRMTRTGSARLAWPTR